MTEKLKFCLVVYGNPGNGKTFASKTIASKFNSKLIHFDEIINLIVEYIRKTFGNATKIDFQDNNSQDIFSIQENFSAFTDELDLLLSKEKKFFMKLYDNEIKDKKPIKNYQSGFDNDVINLGKIGDLLETFSENIIKILVKTVLKNYDLVIIEGYHLSDGKKYRAELAKTCQKISYLGCFFKEKETKSPYLYNGKTCTTLNDVEENISYDLGNKKYKDLSIESSKTKEISLYEVENLLISLYNTSRFYKSLFNGAYRILKIIHRK